MYKHSSLNKFNKVLIRVLINIKYDNKLINNFELIHLFFYNSY